MSRTDYTRSETINLRSPSQERRRRRGWPAAAAGISVAVLAAATFGVREAGEGDARPGEGAGPTWETVGVPWVDGTAVHFAGQQGPRPSEVMSIAATADAAFIAGGARGEVVSLNILTKSGESRVIDDNLTGIPIGDPVGHLAAWTAINPEGGTEVVAFDSASNAVVGTAKVGPQVKVYWVDGDTVYFSDGNAKHHTWRPGSERPEPEETATAEEGILTDRAGDLTVEIAAAGSALVSSDGSVVHTFDGLQFGTFSPDGSLVALTHDKGLVLWDVTLNAAVDLPLPANQHVSGVRWASEGELVVEGVPVTSDNVPDPDAPVRYFVCVPTSKSCSKLPALGLEAGDADGLESSAAGQFATLVG